MPLIALGIGAGVGLLKSQLVDQPREQRQRKLAAATQRYSPWTHLQAGPIQEADPLGSAVNMGLTGYQLKQGYDTNQALQDKMKNYPSSTTAQVVMAPAAMPQMQQPQYSLMPQLYQQNPWSMGGYGY